MLVEPACRTKRHHCPFLAPRASKDLEGVDKEAEVPSFVSPACDGPGPSIGQVSMIAARQEPAATTSRWLGLAGRIARPQKRKRKEPPCGLWSQFLPKPPGPGFPLRPSNGREGVEKKPALHARGVSECSVGNSPATAVGKETGRTYTFCARQRDTQVSKKRWNVLWRGDSKLASSLRPNDLRVAQNPRRKFLTQIEASSLAEGQYAPGWRPC